LSIREGDLALLVIYSKKGRAKKFLVKVKRAKVIHTHKGTIALDDIIGKEWGTVIKTNKGVPVEVHRPNLADIIEKLGRATQIIYPKDSGFILLKSGIKPGDKVVEIGTGSGALTLVLATFLGPEGEVISYDIREKSLNTAKKNLSAMQLHNVTLKLKDAKEGIDEDELDAVFIDIPDPWEILPMIYEKLKPNGTFIAFVPSCEQIQKVVVKARETGFSLIEVHEILDREYESDERRTRPLPRMIAHTGFIIIGRKVIPPS